MIEYTDLLVVTVYKYINSFKKLHMITIDKQIPNREANFEIGLYQAFIQCSNINFLHAVKSQNPFRFMTQGKLA